MEYQTYRDCLTLAKRARKANDHLTAIFWLHEAMISRLFVLRSPKEAFAIERLILEA